MKFKYYFNILSKDMNKWVSCFRPIAIHVNILSCDATMT